MVIPLNVSRMNRYRREQAAVTNSDTLPTIQLDASGLYPAKYSCERVWFGTQHGTPVIQDEPQRTTDAFSFNHTQFHRVTIDFPYEFVVPSSDEALASVLQDIVPAAQWGILWMSSEVLGLHSCNPAVQDSIGFGDDLFKVFSLANDETHEVKTQGMCNCRV
jgi:hypothetical protein